MEEEQQSQEPTEESSATLEDVYNEFNVTPRQDQQPAQNVEQQPPVTQQPQVPVNQTMPDPTLDPDGFNQFQSNQQAALNSQMQQISDQLSSMNEQASQESLAKDIQGAVGTVKGDLDVDDGLVQAFLENKAYQDDRFQAIWDNRANNPKALGAALKAVQNELRGSLRIKQDPTLAETQRAVKQSQNAMPVTDEANENDSWDGDASDFSNKWQKLISQG